MPYATFLLAALLFASVPMASAQDAAPRVLIDFSEPDQADRWRIVNDNVMGGRSEGGPAFTDSTLVFSGSTNTNGGGFSSIRTRAAGFALGDADGILVRYRADGRTYEIGLQTGERAGGFPIAYRASFETAASDGTWQEAKLPFTAFRGSSIGRPVEGAVLDPAGATVLELFIYDGQDGPFRIEVDRIAAYTEPG
ncbi:MAG: CIA30 family protein [Bacteroidota bacterium]